MISSRTKQYAALSLLFLTVGITVAGFTYYQINKEGTQLAQRMEVIGKNKLVQERNNELFAILKKNEAEHEALSGFLLTQGKTVQFLSDVEKLARDTGLSFTTNELEVEPLPNPQFESIDLSLRAEGSEANVIAFLKVLETLPYFSRINELRLVAQKKAGGTTWTANIHLMVALHAYDQ